MSLALNEEQGSPRSRKQLSLFKSLRDPSDLSSGEALLWNKHGREFIGIFPGVRLEGLKHILNIS